VPKCFAGSLANRFALPGRDGHQHVQHQPATYSYDADDQLTGVGDSLGFGYAYDPAGNRTSTNSAGSGTVAATDLSPRDRSEMFALMERHYDNVCRRVSAARALAIDRRQALYNIYVRASYAVGAPILI
jgi:YD repeat-containing protein